MFKIYFLILLSLFAFSCGHKHKKPEYKTALQYSKAKELPSGRLVIVQGPTSSTETNINVLAPRLKNYIYIVKDEQGNTIATEKYDSVHTPPLLWKVDKIFVTGLKPNTKYSLEIVDEFRSSKTRVDQRYFSTLDTTKKNVRFAYASCMADDYRFDEIIDPMWAKMQQQNPDMVILNGDLVYVDSFEFVERQKATELDIWFRFIDSLNRLPIYHWQDLKPILATWDDHDFGTNDSDRTFKSKQAARNIFLAFFGGKNLKDTYELEKDSVYFKFTGFNQKMLFMDDRYFRQPNKEQKVAEKYAQWGEKQHQWLISNLNDSTPAWIFNGGQFFSGNDLKFKESLQTNNPEHYKTLLQDMKQVKAPAVFASGDIHFSEIMAIPADRIGYPTYEVTSSSMHSYTGEGWTNPLRMDGAFTTEFNFMIIDSRNENGAFKIDVESWGLSKKPYFKKQLEIKK